MNNRKAIVTGGLGFIGHHLVNLLIEEGFEVKVVDNLSTGKEENKNEKAEYVIKDINDLEAGDFIGADFVFHLAALPRVAYSVENPIETNQVNINGALKVFETARVDGVGKVIYSASSSAYGNQETMPLREDMMPNPLSPYALQKLVGEYYCRLFFELYGLKTVSLRYFNVYGPEQDESSSYTGVITLFKKAKREGKEAVVYGDGEQARDFTYVIDVARANLLAALSDLVGKGEVINIGGGEQTSVNKLAEIIGVKTRHEASRLGDPRFSLADISKAKELISWEPKVSVEEGLLLF